MAGQKTQTGAQFSLGAATSKPSISLQAHDTLSFPDYSLGVPVRLYAVMPSSIQLLTDVGTVERTGFEYQEDKKDVMVISDSDTASISGPILSANFTWQLVHQCGDYDLSGLKVRWDEETQEVKFSRKVTAIVTINYTTKYQLLRYTPKQSRLTDSYGVVTDISGNKVEYGTIFALEPTTCTIVTYDVPPVNSILGPRDKDSLEIYRVYSEFVVSEQELYEKPNGWPDTTWNSKGDCENELEIGGNSVVVQRVHEIGYLPASVAGSLGSVYVTTYNVQYYCPFTGSLPWTGLKLWLQWSSRPTNDPDYADAYDHVNFAEVTADIKSRYPTVQTK